MPQTPHVEKHFQSSDVVRDIVIGMADGLTVPFALAAGLSGAVDSTRVVITSRTSVVRSTSTSYSVCTFKPRRASFSVISDSERSADDTRSATTAASMSGRMIW